MELILERAADHLSGDRGRSVSLTPCPCVGLSLGGNRNSEDSGTFDAPYGEIVIPWAPTDAGVSGPCGVKGRGNVRDVRGA